jgi:putative endonuclease
MAKYSVYIMTNRNRTTLYVGVTNNLRRRVREHQSLLREGFTSRYKLTTLVWFEQFDNVVDALACEKRIKGWTRAKKNALVESKNPSWRDLAQIK